MSVIVQGMQMPESCEDCPMCRAFPIGDYDIDVKCTYLNKRIPKDSSQRRKDCPLSPAEQTETGIFDIEEVHHNCVVEVWKNSTTGEVSVGWRQEDECTMQNMQ